MNKHQKLALFIAPLLMIIGYIASDYYIESQAHEPKLFVLQTEGECDVLNKQCVLSSGEFKLSVFDVEGRTTINSTFPLDAVTLFIVDEKSIATPYGLKQQQTAYYWDAETPVRNMIGNSALPLKLRVIARVKGGQYISEFNAKAGF